MLESHNKAQKRDSFQAYIQITFGEIKQNLTA